MSSKQAALLSPPSKESRQQGPITPQNELLPKEPPPATVQKRGQKKGSNMELLALRADGGSGGIPLLQVEGHETPWKFCKDVYKENL